jgi:hypothetical protein
VCVSVVWRRQEWCRSLGVGVVDGWVGDLEGHNRRSVFVDPAPALVFAASDCLPVLHGGWVSFVVAQLKVVKVEVVRELLYFV